MKRTCIYLVLFISFVLSGASRFHKELTPEILAALERVMSEIYRLDTQDIQNVVQEDFGPIPDISADDLRIKMLHNPNLLVVNVLTEKWYRDCHIEGSLNVPLNKLIYLMDEYDRELEIVVYCALDECDASEKAYVLLRWLGFENVVDYRGGIKEWFQLGYPVEGACVSSYLHEGIQNRFDERECIFDFDFCTLLRKSYKQGHELEN